MAINIARYRWAFLAIAVVSLGAGFYFNILQPATRLARIIFGVSLVFTVATLLHWGWWLQL